MHRSLEIAGTAINDDADCYVIAEVGHNHQGDVAKAIQMFQAAKYCGVSAVKLQKRDNRALYTRSMLDKPYENENSFGATYGEHREALEFGESEYLELKACAEQLGLTMFATAFDFPSVDFLARLDMPAYKIASGDLKNIPLLKYVASVGKPVIVSTGGGSIDDVQRVVDEVTPINPQLALLQCTACYPTSPELMNLAVISTMRARFPNLVMGLSDHYNGIAMAVVAYMLGARIIEKHFTMNHTWRGTDHAMSLEPTGMQKMIRDLQRTRLALGDGEKRPLDAEKPALVKMGKSVVAARDLPSGWVLREIDVAFKSPGGIGVPPYKVGELLGKRLKAPLHADDPILAEQLEPAVELDSMEIRATA